MTDIPDEIYCIDNADQPVPEIWSSQQIWQNEHCTKYIRADLVPSPRTKDKQAALDALEVLVQIAQNGSYNGRDADHMQLEQIMGYEEEIRKYIEAT